MALNILIVDDSRVMRAMVLKTLKISAIPLEHVFQAANGQEGLNQLKAHWIDLVLADINMPVMNGEEMIRRMKANAETKSIPIIAVSTEGSEARIAHLKSLGVLFVHKPFSPELLRDSIVKLTGIEIDNE